MVQKAVPAAFEQYVDRFPNDVQKALRKMRATIKAAAPNADETISYKIPAFRLNGKMLVWYAAFKSHIGLYPGAAAVAQFSDRLSEYKTAKGSIQFPLERALPTALIEEIVRFNVRLGK